jgi:hypothetical protein
MQNTLMRNNDGTHSRQYTTQQTITDGVNPVRVSFAHLSESGFTGLED